MLELRGMLSILSLRSLPGQLCPRVVASDRVLSMGLNKLNCNSAKLNCFKLNCLYVLKWT